MGNEYRIVELISSCLYGPPWLSWLTTLMGTSLFGGIFVFIFRRTKPLNSPKRWALRGTSFGFLVLPLSVWLYAQFFTGPIRALVLGFPGLFLLLHFYPFQNPALISHEIVKDSAKGATWAFSMYLLLGTTFWSLVYTLVGYILGKLIHIKNCPIRS